ncbi:MAG: ABA4-like family protein [Pseudomonadota bacterium]
MDAFIDAVRQAAQPAAVFSAGSSLALLGWVILIFLPRRYAVLFAVPQFIIPFVLGLLYAAMILPKIYTGEGGFGSIEQVRALFQDDAALTGGWLHYLAFDLFIGAWIAARADTIGVPRLIQAPILLGTFMFGPVGLVLFLTMRPFFTRDNKAVE